MGGTLSTGHCVTFPQNIEEFADNITSLPHSIPDLPVIIVRYQKQNGSGHKDFFVCRDRILKALQWLIKNNKFYRDIKIDQEKLNALPENGDVSEMITTITAPDPKYSDQEPTAQTTNAAIPDTTPDDVHLETTGCMNATTTADNKTITRKIVEDAAEPGNRIGHDKLQGNIVAYPTRESVPVNEFTTVGLLAKSFPTLFPYGNADFTTPRLRTITILQYFKHLMLYYDKTNKCYPFAKHPVFVHYAVNLYQRHTALTQGRVYKNVCVKNLSPSELLEKLDAGDSQCLNGLLYFAQKLVGTEQHYNAEKNKAVSLAVYNRFANNQTMELFFSLTAADFHWDALHEILPNSEAYLHKTIIPNGSQETENTITQEHDIQLRKKAIAENPGNSGNSFLSKKGQ